MAQNNRTFTDTALLDRPEFLTQGAGEPPIEVGAVYYRRSNPPRQDWERDYGVAREDGHTIFRHWFTWNAIHVAPNTFDFEPFDCHLKLAAQNGIKTIIGEHVYEAPDWLYHKYPHARRELANGNTHSSIMGNSDGLGITRMCLDNEEVRKAAEQFLYALGRHYRDNPGLYGYDIWNECSLYDAKSMCYCPATQRAFRLWLRDKYDDSLEALRQAWRRYSITGWEDIEMPRQIQPFPDTIDMVNFQLDNAQKWLKLRADTLREADGKHFITAHGNAKTFCDLPACGDDYRSAQYTDIYGYTFWYGNGCNTMLGSDMIRVAAAGRRFWRAEAIGDRDWEGRGGATAPIAKKEVMHDPQNIRLDFMMSLCAGARGFINPRWRALQEGHLFGGYGWYNLDGSRSPRSEEIKGLAAWANGPRAAALWQAAPVRGQVGLLLLEDAQIYCYSFYNDTQYYSLAYQGAYEAFLNCNIQADPIRLWDIDKYSILYLPFPVALKGQDVEKLTRWVENGGTLVAEGCLGYFSEAGHAFAHQPSRGLDALCGAVEDEVSFAPDMWHGLELAGPAGRLGGGVFRQSYRPTTGTAAGWYDDGGVAVVDNAYGKGRVRLIGTMAGYGYKQTPKAEYLGFFASLLPLAGERQLVRLPYNTGLLARIWASGEETFVWCLNTGRAPQRAQLELDGMRFHYSGAKALRGGEPQKEGGLLCVEVPGRDAAVLQLTQEDDA